MYFAKIVFKIFYINLKDMVLYIQLSEKSTYSMQSNIC